MLVKVEMAKDELDRKYKDLEEKYEQKRLALLIVEAELQCARAVVDQCLSHMNAAEGANTQDGVKVVRQRLENVVDTSSRTTTLTSRPCELEKARIGFFKMD